MEAIEELVKELGNYRLVFVGINDLGIPEYELVEENSAQSAEISAGGEEDEAAG